MAKQYGIDSGQIDKMIKGLQQHEYRDVRLTTIENGKQVPTHLVERARRGGDPRF